MLSAHTVASKLLAEPYLYANYQYKMKQLNIRPEMPNEMNLKKSAMMSFFNISTTTTATTATMVAAAGGEEEGGGDSVAMEVDVDEGDEKGNVAITGAVTTGGDSEMNVEDATGEGGENDTAADTNDNEDDDGASESATSTPKRRRTSPRISSTNTSTQQHDTEGDGDGDIYDTHDPTTHSTAVHYTPRSVSRYVEMCHIHTGEVLRLFLNQKSASLVLGVTQSGKKGS